MWQTKRWIFKHVPATKLFSCCLIGDHRGCVLARLCNVFFCCLGAWTLLVLVAGLVIRYLR